MTTKGVSIRSRVSPNSDINVTPLVDVVLVLLIIFMVVTPLLERDIAVALPSLEKVESLNEVPADQLVVRIDEAGALRINGEAVPSGDYVERLKGRLERRAPKDRIVFVAADDRASYAQLVAAMDGAKRAGATTLGMATESPEVAATRSP